MQSNPTLEMNLRDADAPTAEALLALADKALYAVKGARKRLAVLAANGTAAAAPDTR